MNRNNKNDKPTPHSHRRKVTCGQILKALLITILRKIVLTFLRLRNKVRRGWRNSKRKWASLRENTVLGKLPTFSQAVSDRRILIPAGILAMLLMFLLVIQFLPLTVKINGPSHMTVDVYSDFEDPGAVDPRTDRKIKAEGSVDTGSPGKYELVYRNGFQKMTRVVNVVDRTAPTLTTDAAKYVYIPVGGKYEDPSFTVEDNYDKLTEKDVKVRTKLKTSKAGTYKVRYQVTDSSGNKSAVFTRKVVVLDDDFQYQDEIRNKADADQAMVDLMVDWFNHMYKTMRYLEVDSASGLFTSKSCAGACQSDALFELITASRQSKHVDLHLTKCKYNLTIKDVTSYGKGYKVTAYDTSSVEFGYLKGKDKPRARLSHILTDFYIVKDGDDYKISEVYREDSLFSYVEDKGVSSAEGVRECREAYVEEMEKNDRAYEKCRRQVNKGKTYDAPKVDHAYDRDAAVKYAQKYALDRCSKYAAFSSNCMNFSSQCLHAGGIEMGSNWQYTKSYGNTSSWTYTLAFRSYISGATSPKMSAEEGVDLYFAEKGDLLYVSNYEGLYPHIVVITDVIRSKDGKVLDLLINGNTNDQKSYPMSALSYRYKILVKVNGYND